MFFFPPIGLIEMVQQKLNQHSYLQLASFTPASILLPRSSFYKQVWSCHAPVLVPYASKIDTGSLGRHGRSPMVTLLAPL